MSSPNVNHNVHAARWVTTAATASNRDIGALTAAGGATETLTSEWIDTSGWTDRVVSVDVDSGGTIDFNLTMHISSQGYYELNNKTCTTEDYVAVSIVDALASGVYTRYDSDDIDELKVPVRSVRFVIENDQAEPVTGSYVKIEGWS